MYTYREKWTPFLEIPRALVFAYVNQSFFDSGLHHMPRFGQWALTGDTQREAGQVLVHWDLTFWKVPFWELVVIP